MKSKMVVGVSSLFLVFAGLIISAPASHAAQDCVVSTTYEVDGYHGQLIFYPSFKCYSDKTAVVMSTFPGGGGGEWTNTEARVTYSGTGITVPLDGSREYCVQINTQPSIYNISDSYYDRPCVVI